MARIKHPSRSITSILGALALATVAVLLAGCGGSSTPGVAHLSANDPASSSSGEGSGSKPESSASTQQKMVAYADCMRSHGVPDFPEPNEGRLLFRGGSGSGVNPNSAQFQDAEKTCHKLMPEGGKPSPQMQRQAQERALQFSACMRSHGAPNFPEPEFTGTAVRLHVKVGGGLDPNSPEFQAAQKACAPYFGPKGGKGFPLGPPPRGPGGGEVKQESSVGVAP